MDRHQDVHYEEEQIVNMGPANVPNGEPVDDMRFFIGLIKLMRDTVETSRGMGRWKLMDADQLTEILNELDRNLPVAIQYGQQMYSERDRIMGNSEEEARKRIVSAELLAKRTKENAQADADNILADAAAEAEAILADAQQRADIMVSEETIISRAREEARAIKSDASIEAKEMLLKAQHDALDIVLKTENELTAAIERISNRRVEISSLIKE